MPTQPTQTDALHTTERFLTRQPTWPEAAIPDPRAPTTQQVLHEADNFQEGETVILTLADSRVVKRENGQGYVNEEEDVLENVAMSEFEKTAIAKERAKTRAKYMNADDDEFTAGGKSTNLLSKYDDFEVDGQKIGTNKEDRKSIRLGDKGELDLTKEERQAAIRAKLSQAPGKVIVSLDMKIKEESDFQVMFQSGP